MEIPFILFISSGNSIPPYLEWEPEQPPLFILSGDGRPGTRANQL